MRRAALGALLAACCGAGAAAPAGAAEVGTWGLAPASSAPPLADRTVRMMVRTTAGGDSVRVRLSNAAGRAPVTFGTVTVALRGEGAALAGPPVPVTFLGERSVTVPARADALSDAVPFSVPAGRDLAVSLHVAGLVPRVTAHLSARKTSYLALGDATGERTGAAFAETTTSALFLTDVMVSGAAAGTIVGLGSSSVDGTGTRTDAEERWSDVMMRRMLAGRAPCGRYGYVNAGVDADTIEGIGSRLERDVLAKANVRYVIFYLGSGNDIATGDSAEEAIAQTLEIVRPLQARGIRVIGGTLIPREQATLPGQEAERVEYNAWVRGGGAFDAVIDFEKPVEDPQRPGRYRPGFSDDGIHTGPEGNRLQGEAIDLELFEPACPPPPGPSDAITPARFKPRLAVRASRRGRALTVRGRLRLPAGVTRSRACAGGRATIRLRRRGHTVARRRARVTPRCTFRARLRHPRGRARLVVRFLGTPSLRPARAVRRTSA